MENTKGGWSVSHNKPYGWKVSGDNFTVAMSNDTDAETNPEQARANGNLIAAAPTIYEALKEARKWLRYDRKVLGLKNGDYLLTQMNKALARAEGGRDVA